MTRPDIRTLIQEGTEQIGRFETMVLLAHALGVRREFLIAHDLDVPDEEKVEKFRLYVVMRKSGTPVPYITGEQDFYGRFFEVNPSVLIPRPDTEVLVDTALELFDEAPRVLDLGTGSGCLAVTLALEMKNSEVVATDVSQEALLTAERNAEKLKAKVAFRRGAWWEAVGEEEQFDLIVSNPPYIRADDEHLANLMFEPRSALTDEGDGLSALAVIALGAPAHLRSGGWLLPEHGYDQGEACRNLLQHAGFLAVRTVKDFGGNDRVTLGTVGHFSG